MNSITAASYAHIHRLGPQPFTQDPFASGSVIAQSTLTLLDRLSTGTPHSLSGTIGTIDSIGCERRCPLARIEETQTIFDVSLRSDQNSLFVFLVVVTSRYCYTRVTANVKQHPDYQHTDNRIIHGILV